jgi:uncharacterized protein
MSPRLPDALLDPCAYPDRPASVEMRETHISWVFLAGCRVYKVKKPVSFRFVDYATVERRRAACGAEVRLGCRFAPAVYAGVVALVPRGPDGLAVAHEADPAAVEYAVEMCRYDERRTLAARLAAGQVTDRQAAAVGGAIARWHAAAPVSRLGGADGWRLSAVTDETLATLAASGVLEPRRLAGLERFCGAALDGLRPELAGRAYAGRAVRDGHGDLRAEHVLMGPHIEAVDGLEFDPALRIADVAYDLAFLVMDVSRRDDRLARAVLRGYVAAGGDPGSDRLLAFFCALRALVRAKVDVLRADQLPGEEAAERRARADDLLALAERFAWDARLPSIVCVGGLAASGKSTLANALANASGRAVIGSDRLRKARAGLIATDRAPAVTYADRESREVYAELGRRVAAARRDGGVIVDATFRRSEDVAAFSAALGDTEAPGWLVCRAPADVLLARAERRTTLPGTTSDADAAVVAAQLAHAPEALPLPAPALVELDTTLPPRELLNVLAGELDGALARAPTRRFVRRSSGADVPVAGGA